MRRYRLGVFLGLSLLLANPGFAQNEPEEDALPEAEMVQETLSELDQHLTERDYQSLGARFNNPTSALDARTYLDWLGSKFMSGESSFVAFYYSRYLQAYAEELPEEQAPNILGTALAAMIYAITVSDIDAQQCSDRTARADRPQTFVQHLAASGLLDLDVSFRESAAAIALELEKRGWPNRQEINDAGFLCMNGMTAMMAGLAAGNVREVEPTEGQLGQTMGVTPPEGFDYVRLEDDIWLPEAEKRRTQLSQTIMTLSRTERIPTLEELM